MLLNMISYCLLLTLSGASKAKTFPVSFHAGENAQKLRCACENTSCPLWSSLVAEIFRGGGGVLTPLFWVAGR